ncbi:chaplin [Streptomyces sp. NPDC127098]|uniref:chaplin n=1 Tax=Streptomyces sp. NPDC127098 TaxID=3347137 RepID=UPI003668FB86
MRQVTRKGLLTVVAAGGVFAISGGTAFADSDAAGAAVGSPGVLSGNNVQVPVNAPIQVCGNTVNVVGVLNPAFGNGCVSESGSHAGQGGHGAQQGDDGAEAGAVAVDSPGVGSGNNVEVPVDVPVQACGNSVDVVGVLNPVFGNECEQGDGPERPRGPEEPEQPGPERPGDREPEPEAPEGHDPVAGDPEDESGPRPAGSVAEAPAEEEAAEPTDGELAETGSELPLGAVLAVGGGLLVGGSVLYRRARVGSQG